MQHVGPGGYRVLLRGQTANIPDYPICTIIIRECFFLCFALASSHASLRLYRGVVHPAVQESVDSEGRPPDRFFRRFCVFWRDCAEIMFDNGHDP